MVAEKRKSNACLCDEILLAGQGRFKILRMLEEGRWIGPDAEAYNSNIGWHGASTGLYQLTLIQLRETPRNQNFAQGQGVVAKGFSDPCTEISQGT